MIAALLTGARAIGARLGLVHYVCIALAVFAIVQTVRIDGAHIGPIGWNGLKAKYETAIGKLAAERAGRIADRKAYEDAQKKAAELNKAQVNRIVSEQEKINAEAKSRYQRDLERLRAGGLRKDIAAPQGSSGCSNPGAVPQAAAGVDGPAAMCVLREDLLRGAEVELRLLHLQEWIREQLQVER